MKMKTVVFTAILTAFPMLPANGYAQTQENASTLIIAGRPGEAPLMQINGKSYIDVESLARLTQGSLSFKANQTILTLPVLAAEATAPHPTSGFSSAFAQASIEELSVIREWRNVIVNAVQKNTPASIHWINAQHALAEKNLALASAAASTDDDHSAYSLLAAEFNNMQTLSERYLAIRKQNSFISPDTFNSTSLQEQIQSCARDYAAMMKSRVFQDLRACR